MRHVALATCAELPDGDEDAGDLVAALARAGIDASWHSWNDAGVDWDGFDVTLLRSTWDYTHDRAAFLAWTATVPRLLNTAEVVAWNSDKTYLRDLAAAGVPVVPTGFHVPGSTVALPAAGDIVLKPVVGAGSRGVGRFRLPEQAAAAREHAQALHAAGRTVLSQTYLAGVDTAGETAVVCLGGVPCHAARKAPLLVAGGAHPLRGGVEEHSHALYLKEHISRATATPAELAVAGAALRFVADRFGSLPYARVDLLPGSAGPVVVELELIEPSLFLAYAPDPTAAADRLVAALA